MVLVEIPDLLNDAGCRRKLLLLLAHGNESALEFFLTFHEYFPFASFNVGRAMLARQPDLRSGWMQPAAGETDAELVARCRAGDGDAWNALVERFSRFVFAICVRGFRLSESDAEDVFQDVFAKTFEQLHALRDNGAIRPWIAQLTRRACIDRIRASRETPIAEMEDTAADTLAEIDQALDIQLARLRCPSPAGRSSTGSSPATRPTARSERSWGCLRARLRAGSRAAWRS